MPEGLRDLGKLFGGASSEEPPVTQAEGGDGGRLPPEVTLAEPPDEEPKRAARSGELTANAEQTDTEAEEVQKAA